MSASTQRLHDATDLVVLTSAHALAWTAAFEQRTFDAYAALLDQQARGQVLEIAVRRTSSRSGRN
jgi:hypothetical protein